MNTVSLIKHKKGNEIANKAAGDWLSKRFFTALLSLLT